MSHIVVARWRPRVGEEETAAAILRARAVPGNVSSAAHRAFGFWRYHAPGHE